MSYFLSMKKPIVLLAVSFFLSTLVVIGVLYFNHASDPYISAVIVPHHDLVAAQRTETFAKLAPRTQGRRIILLSPNHYNNGDAAIQTRSEAFTTQYGNIPISQELFEVAKNQGAAEVSTTFEIEHGIRSLLSDIVKHYPDIEIVPIVVSEHATRQNVTNLMDAFNDTCADCLLVTSADFSHYQPYQLSELHDRLSIRGLQTLDGELLDTRAELEPMPHPWMTTYWAKLHNTERFVVDQRTNSTELTNDYYAEGTTHIMGWYETGLRAVPAEGVSFTISGPLLFGGINDGDRYKSYQLQLNQLGNRVLWGTDMVLGRVPEGDNHNKNIMAARRAADFLHFTHRGGEFENPAIIQGQGQRIVLFAVDADAVVLNRIEEFSEDNVVLYINWGHLTQELRRDHAHDWIEAGADVVIGSGQDELLPAENYKGRPIVYSLGAFVTPSGQDASLALAGYFGSHDIELLPMLIKQNEAKTILQRSEEADTVLKEYFKAFSSLLVDERGGLLFSIPK